MVHDETSTIPPRWRDQYRGKLVPSCTSHFQISNKLFNRIPEVEAEADFEFTYNIIQDRIFMVPKIIQWKP